MRISLLVIAIAISDLAKTDLSVGTIPLAAIFSYCLIFDLWEAIKK